MATFSLSIHGELDELAQIAQRLAGFTPQVETAASPTAYEQAAADNGYTAAAPAPAAPPAEPARRQRKPKDEPAAPVPTQTADAAPQADTSASPTEAGSSAGTAPAVSPENMTHPDQLLGSDVTPDMLKDAMTDALSKRLIPAAKVQGALKEATGGIASLTNLWALPADADRAEKAAKAYAALIALQA